MSRTPSRKKASKNKRNREQKKRQRERDAARDQHVIIRGQVVHRECRFEMFISSVLPFSQPIPINALVDTGATGISVSPEVARSAGLQVVSTAEVRTASDAVVAPVAIARLHLHVEGRTIVMTAPVIVMDGQDDPMLFGMDGLAGGTLHVDRIQETWEIRIKQIA